MHSLLRTTITGIINSIKHKCFTACVLCPNIFRCLSHRGRGRGREVRRALRRGSQGVLQRVHPPLQLAPVAARCLPGNGRRR